MYLVTATTKGASVGKDDVGFEFGEPIKDLTDGMLEDARTVGDLMGLAAAASFKPDFLTGRKDIAASLVLGPSG